MRKNRPWYWVARRAWFATHENRRIRLATGPKDAATEARALAEYKKLVTPPELRPEIVEQRIRDEVERRVRERLDEAYRRGFEDGRREAEASIRPQSVLPAAAPPSPGDEERAEAETDSYLMKLERIDWQKVYAAAGRKDSLGGLLDPEWFIEELGVWGATADTLKGRFRTIPVRTTHGDRLRAIRDMVRLFGIDPDKTDELEARIGGPEEITPLQSAVEPPVPEPLRAAVTPQVAPALPSDDVDDADFVIDFENPFEDDERRTAYEDAHGHFVSADGRPKYTDPYELGSEVENFLGQRDIEDPSFVKRIQKRAVRAVGIDEREDDPNADIEIAKEFFTGKRNRNNRLVAVKGYTHFRDDKSKEALVQHVLRYVRAKVPGADDLLGKVERDVRSKVFGGGFVNPSEKGKVHVDRFESMLVGVEALIKAHRQANCERLRTQRLTRRQYQTLLYDIAARAAQRKVEQRYRSLGVRDDTAEQPDRKKSGEPKLSKKERKARREGLGTIITTGGRTDEPDMPTISKDAPGGREAWDDYGKKYQAWLASQGEDIDRPGRRRPRR